MSSRSYQSYIRTATTTVKLFHLYRLFLLRRRLTSPLGVRVSINKIYMKNGKGPKDVLL